MTTPPSTPGWRDDPDGRRRWWDGQRWGAYAPWDDHGAAARPEAPQRPRLDRSLTFDPTAAGRIARARPSAPSAPGAPTRSSGFLPAGAGASNARPEPARPAKRMALAYALAIVLGPLGAHRFYLGRVPSATVQMVLSFAALAAFVVVRGADDAPLWLLAVPAVALAWWIADLCRTAGMVREHNRAAAARPSAPGYERGWPDP